MLVLPLVVVLGGVPLLAVLLAALLPARSPRPDRGSRLARVDRSTRTWRLVGLLAGAGGAILVQHEGPLGSGLMLAGPVLVLGVLTGVLVGELRVTAPAGPRRSAMLEVRRVRDYLDRPLAVAVTVALVVLVGFLAVTTATAAPDDMGRAGRALVLACDPAGQAPLAGNPRAGAAADEPVVIETRTPWPGSFYSVPLLGMVAGGLLAAGAALARIVRRPRQGGPADADDELRRQAVESVVASVGMLVAVPLAGVLGISAVLLGGATCLPAGAGLAAGLGVGVLLALVLVAWSGVALLDSTIGRRVGSEARAR